MDKSSVSPFLFDIKRSEVDGPILQFQSTIFEREDLKKLVKSLNKACEKDGLAGDRLEKAFEVWYPTLESELEELRGTTPDSAADAARSDVETPRAQEILEEILELSRINQKLLRNPEGPLGANLEQMNDRLLNLLERLDQSEDPMGIRRSPRVHPMMLEEFLHSSYKGRDRFVRVEITLALIRNQFPWLYDAGIETVKILRSRRSLDEKRMAMGEFTQLLEFSFEHPLMRRMYDGSKEYRMFFHELPRLLARAMEESMSG